MFKLTRHFSRTSLIGIVAVVAALLFLYRQLALQALVEHENQANVALTRVFANTLWPRYSAFVNSAFGVPKAELPRRPEIIQLREDILRQMKGLKVVKVKIYDLKGLTVFSTDPKQIGEDKGRNSGFLSAKSGKAASEITFREHFDAFEQVINDRNLVSSYIPIRESDAAPVEAVVEVYADVTTLVETLETIQWQIAGGVLGSLALLYFFLFLIVRRADSIIVADQAKLVHQAYHDPLTGLPNRALFHDQCEQTFRRADRHGRPVGVLFIDLDRFKAINDSLGHAMGDLLLQRVGKRLAACVRETDAVARTGGDEFTVLVDEMSEPRYAATVAEKLLGAMTQPFPVGDHKFVISASIGISCYPNDGSDVHVLLKNADAAMYRAKEEGRNTYRFFSAEMNADALRNLVLTNHLREALERNELSLHYQPRVALATGRIAGAEVLVRWQHPEYGLVLPARFIPLAEDSGLIGPIGEWVLKAACAQMRTWHNSGMPDFRLAVNLSVFQFRHPELLQRIASVLGETGIKPGSLEFEITESMLMQDSERTLDLLTGLNTIGVAVAVDDFGTGYSSLSYLKRFPIDCLKIDQSFVQGIPADSDDVAITRTIIAVAKTLNLRLVAEGIETEEQLAFLRAEGCEEGQGYLFSKPVAAEHLQRLFRESGARGWRRAAPRSAPPAPRAIRPVSG